MRKKTWWWLVAVVPWSGMGGMLAAAPQPQDVRKKDLRLWLRADQGVERDAENRVWRWADQSGNGHDASQKPAAERPEYLPRGAHGKPALRFDGANSWLEGSLGSLPAPFTLVAVASFARMHQPDGDFDYIVSIGDILRAGGHVGVSRWGSKVPNDERRNRYYSVYDSPNHVDLLGPVIPGEATLIIAVLHATEPPKHRLFVNGLPQTVMDSPSSVSLNGSYTLGKLRYPGVAHHLCGEIAEILVYDVALSDRERQSVETYLKAKYGLR